MQEEVGEAVAHLQHLQSCWSHRSWTPLDGHHQPHPTEAWSYIWTSVPWRWTSACQAHFICKLVWVGTSFYKRRSWFGPHIDWNFWRSRAESLSFLLREQFNNKVLFPFCKQKHLELKLLHSMFALASLFKKSSLPSAPRPPCTNSVALQGNNSEK